MLLPETISRILTVHNNEGMDQNIKSVLEKINLDLKQLIVLACPGETVHGIIPDSLSENDTWKVVGLTIDEEGTWYRLEDENGYGWNLDTEKFLMLLTSSPHRVGDHRP